MIQIYKDSGIRRRFLGFKGFLSSFLNSSFIIREQEMTRMSFIPENIPLPSALRPKLSHFSFFSSF